MVRNVKDVFDLSGKVAVITGGAGMLGVMHAEAITEAGGSAVLVDINGARVKKEAERITGKYRTACMGVQADITSLSELMKLRDTIIEEFGRIDILINNAANDPKVQADQGLDWSRLENFPKDIWDQDIAVGLTGAFLCSQVFGSEMASRKCGVILNISSDLGVIAPDQRIYMKDGLAPDKQPVKPVTYSVVKHALIGLTKYLATYWAGQNVRVNAICPGGVQTDQPEDFVSKLTNLIPMGRMARKDEYKGAILFLVSDASAYMTGATLNIDGGRTAW